MTRDFDGPAVDPFVSIDKIDRQLRLLIRHTQVKDPRKLEDAWSAWGAINNLLDQRLLVMEIEREIAAAAVG